MQKFAATRVQHGLAVEDGAHAARKTFEKQASRGTFDAVIRLSRLARQRAVGNCQAHGFDSLMAHDSHKDMRRRRQRANERRTSKIGSLRIHG